MKVLLKRRLFLGDIMYEPVATGTELPDKIGDRKVVLYDPKKPPKPRRDPAILFEVSPDQSTMKRVMPDKLVDEDDSNKDVIVLPEDVVLWSDEAAKKFSPEGVQLIKGHPQVGDQVPLSALTPGLSKAEQEAAIKKDLPGTLADKANKEKELLDAPVVGKK